MSKSKNPFKSLIGAVQKAFEDTKESKEARRLESQRKEARKEEKENIKLLKKEAKRLARLEAQRKDAEEGFKKKKTRVLVVVREAINSPEVKKALGDFFREPGPLNGAAIGAAVAGTGLIDIARVGIILGESITELRGMLDGEKPYDPAKPPFILQLLGDPDVLEFLRSAKTNLNTLLDAIAPGKFVFTQLPPDLRKALEGKGLGSKYFDEHIRPIVIDLVKTLIADPETLLKVSDLVLKMQLSKSPEEKKVLLHQILESIDPATLLNSPPLQVFLKEQGTQLSHLVGVVLRATGVQLPVSATLTQDAVAAFAPVLGATFAHPALLKPVHEAVVAVVVDNTDDKIRKATSLAEVAVLDTASTQKKLRVATEAAALLATPVVISAFAVTLPIFLGTHGSAIAGIVSSLAPGAIAGVIQSAETLANTCHATLDRGEIAKIITPPAVRFLATFDKAFYLQLVPTVLGLVPTVLADPLVVEKAKAVIASPTDTYALAALFESVGRIVNMDGARTAFTEGLPTFVVAHQVAIRDGILRVVGNLGLEAEVVDASLEIAVKLLPTVHAIASSCLAAPTGLAGIVSEAHAVMNAPAGKQDKAVQELLNKIFNFVEQNPNAKKTIGTDLPMVLEENAAALSKVLDHVLTRTGFGKILKDIKTEAILKLAAGKVPQLAGIAKLYGERRFAAMVLKTLKTILSDREVLRVVVKIGVSVLKHKMSRSHNTTIRRTPASPSR